MCVLTFMHFHISILYLDDVYTISFQKYFPLGNTNKIFFMVLISETSFGIHHIIKYIIYLVIGIDPIKLKKKKKTDI